MAVETGDLKIFNPDKEISREITLDILIRHRDALKQARTGQLPASSVDDTSQSERKFNQVRGLTLIIAAQREMINISRPILYFKAVKTWEKEYKTEEERQENVFEEHKNDYNKIKYALELLKACEQDIIEADRTKTLDDDFIIEKMDFDGSTKHELTQNFYDMLDELENTYEQVYLLMLTNKIVSAGIEEDEEATYKQKEEEAVRRIVEA